MARKIFVYILHVFLWNLFDAYFVFGCLQKICKATASECILGCSASGNSNWISHMGIDMASAQMSVGKKNYVNESGDTTHER